MGWFLAVRKEAGQPSCGLMDLPWDKFLRDFILIVAVSDPFGTLSLFTSLSANLSAVERRRLAFRAARNAACVLLGAIVIGQVLLDLIGVNLVALRIAGSVILFLFGLQMVFGRYSRESIRVEEGADPAVFPLAVPSLAGAGTITAVIVLTDNDLYPLAVQAGTSVMMLLAMGVAYGLMRAGDWILARIGKSGADLLVRVAGLVLAALAVQLLGKIFPLPVVPS